MEWGIHTKYINNLFVSQQFSHGVCVSNNDDVIFFSI